MREVIPEGAGTVIRLLLVAFALSVSQGRAQFSPGELSAPHSELEGIGNCTDCHEVGAEITGAKCLVCHSEIKAAIGSRHGFHAATASQKCTVCHKEHLGLNAETVLILRQDFDHTKTGFILEGKHSGLRCEDCHKIELVKDQAIVTMMMKTGRASLLGLQTACVSCHTDRHAGTLGPECQTCHTSERWLPAATFDHSRTLYPLAGKHSSVTCQKCHPPSPDKEQRLFDVPQARFADCVPCHTSPHRAKLGEFCSSCHSPAGWNVVVSANFDHTATGFPLKGRHSNLDCVKCHGTAEERQTGGRRTTMRVCADCHADYHRGEFISAYKNDCSRCHDERTFRPSTFTLTMHDEARFRLTGAHVATVCQSCHTRTEAKEQTFRFESVGCTGCHSDPHGGQFTAPGKSACSDCHTTSSWRLPFYDHSTTRFDLVGKHASVPCSKCHKPEMMAGRSVVRFVDTPARCESCHQDPHHAQFASGSNTTCSACHSPEGWPALEFDHDLQSSFKLSGAHAKVACRNCHRPETIEGATVVRYRPLDAKCETCHGGKVPDEQ